MNKGVVHYTWDQGAFICGRRSFTLLYVFWPETTIPQWIGRYLSVNDETIKQLNSRAWHESVESYSVFLMCHNTHRCTVLYSGVDLTLTLAFEFGRMYGRYSEPAHHQSTRPAHNYRRPPWFHWGHKGPPRRDTCLSPPNFPSSLIVM